MNLTIGRTVQAVNDLAKLKPFYSVYVKRIRDGRVGTVLITSTTDANRILFGRTVLLDTSKEVTCLGEPELDVFKLLSNEYTVENVTDIAKEEALSYACGDSGIQEVHEEFGQLVFGMDLESITVGDETIEF